MYVKPDPKKATKQKTKVIKQSLTPVWNEKFTWKFPVTTTLEKRYLSIEIWDRDRFNRNDFMGALAFELQELLDPDTIKSGWFILLDQEQGSVFNFPSKYDSSCIACCLFFFCTFCVSCAFSLFSCGLSCRVTPKEGGAGAPRKAVYINTKLCIACLSLPCTFLFSGPAACCSPHCAKSRPPR